MINQYRFVCAAEEPEEVNSSRRAKRITKSELSTVSLIRAGSFVAISGGHPRTRALFPGQTCGATNAFPLLSYYLRQPDRTTFRCASSPSLRYGTSCVRSSASRSLRVISRGNLLFNQEHSRKTLSIANSHQANRLRPAASSLPKT
jgi:hypothetical protein